MDDHARKSPADAGTNDEAAFQQHGQENHTGFVITNAEFLTALYGAFLKPHVAAWVTHFLEDPNTAPNRVWYGQRWDGGAYEHPLANTFFSVALLQPARQGDSHLAVIERKKRNFAMLPLVMLDDVGSKADAVDVPPTYLIETSPGNFQAGYLFDVPIESAHDADIYLKALVQKGRLTDAGGQNITRFARLPGGRNTKAKYGEPHAVRLVEWNPGLRYDPMDLAGRLGLELEILQSPRSRQSRSTDRGAKSQVSDDTDEIFQDRAKENPVVTALKSRGLHKTALGSGKHDISCPWLDEHTDRVDHGTAYWEPDAAYPRGGFKCQHGHCEHRRLNDLLGYLAVSPAAAKNRPTLRVVGGQLHIIVAHAERLLGQTGHYFQQGGLIVQVVTDPRGETRVVPLKKPAVQLALTKVAAWARFDKRADDWFEIDAPTTHTAALFDAAEYRTMPPLLTLARQPFMRGNGSICATSGYDAESGVYGVFNAVEFQIPQHPTKDDAEKALSRLLRLLDEFEFASDHDRAAACSGFLTAAVRPTLATAPGYLATAHTFGSGKSYLLDLLSAFATPDEPAAATFVTDDDEMKKQLIATLVESPPVVKFDEMRGDLIPVKCLLSALTAERIEGRILGVSKMARPSTRTLMLFAGNNVTAQSDMTRRVLTVQLDPQHEAPASRRFASDPLGLVRANRGAYLSDALTVIRAWIQAGRPRSGNRPVNGFGQWADWCREPLLWLGQPDPCATMFRQMNDDPDRELLARVIEAWRITFNTHPVMVRELIRRAADVADLHDALNEVAGFKGDIDPKALGKWLKSNAGKIVEGYRIIRDASTKRNAVKWRLTVSDKPAKATDYSDSTDSRESPKNPPEPSEATAGAVFSEYSGAHA